MLSIQRCGRNVSVIRFDGHIFDLDNAEEELDKEGLLLLDFSQVNSINSGDIGMLILLKKRMERLRKRLVLFNVPPLIFEVFEISKLNNCLNVCH